MDTTTTTASTVTSTSYASFLDDPNNMAVYVVIPVFVAVYGGCGVIYCIARLKRFCRRHLAEKNLAKMVRNNSPTDLRTIFIKPPDLSLSPDQKQICDDSAISVVDLTDVEESKPKQSPLPKSSELRLHKTAVRMMPASTSPNVGIVLPQKSKPENIAMPTSVNLQASASASVTPRDPEALTSQKPVSRVPVQRDEKPSNTDTKTKTRQSMRVKALGKFKHRDDQLPPLISDQ